MRNHLPVIIVGAGPTGLMMACLLAYYGIEFRIIDKNAKPTPTSDATWIQPRTLELLELLNLTNTFIKRGHHCTSIQLHGQGKNLIKLSVEEIDSPFRFILMLPQSETESLLIDYLKKQDIHIERSIELIDIQQNEKTIMAALRNKEGDIEGVMADWLIACDGAHSTVREKCQLYFPGKDCPEQFMVADARMNSFVGNHEIHFFFEKKSIFTVFPLGSNKYRIGANLNQSHPRKIFIEKEVREIVNERCHSMYDVQSISWISPFWIHCKKIKSLRQGSIFFAGDAAHIFTPIIGQGLNAGFQDVFNLAWKLALVIHKKSKRSILDSYQQERYPVIKRQMKKAEHLTTMALFETDFLQKIRSFQEKLKSNPTLSKKILNQVTELNIPYEKSPIILYLDKGIIKNVKPGRRAPDVLLANGATLYHHLQGHEHQVILFIGHSKNGSKLLKLREWLQKSYPGLVRVHIVSLSLIEGVEDLIVDSEGLIHQRYKVKNPTIYVIRPDRIVGFYTKTLKKQLLIEWFGSIFSRHSNK